MSFIQIEWQPMFSNRFPNSTHMSIVCTGLVVNAIVP